MNKNILAVLCIVIIIIICVVLYSKYNYAVKNYPILITRPTYLNTQCLNADGCANFTAYTQKIKETPRQNGYGFSISLFFYIHGRNTYNSSQILDENLEKNKNNDGTIMKTDGDTYNDVSRNIISFVDEFGIKYLEKESQLLFRFYFRNLDNSNYKQLKITNVSLQKWHHLVLVIDNRDIYIYYDNNLQLVQTLPYLPEIDVNNIQVSECKNKIQVQLCDDPLTCSVGNSQLKTVTRCANSIDGQISLLQYFNDSIDSRKVSHIYNKFIKNPVVGNFWWL